MGLFTDALSAVANKGLDVASAAVSPLGDAVQDAKDIYNYHYATPEQQRQMVVNEQNQAAAKASAAADIASIPWNLPANTINAGSRALGYDDILPTIPKSQRLIDAAKSNPKDYQNASLIMGAFGAKGAPGAGSFWNNSRMIAKNGLLGSALGLTATPAMNVQASQEAGQTSGAPAGGFWGGAGENMATGGVLGALVPYSGQAKAAAEAPKPSPADVARAQRYQSNIDKLTKWQPEQPKPQAAAAADIGKAAQESVEGKGPAAAPEQPQAAPAKPQTGFEKLSADIDAKANQVAQAAAEQASGLKYADLPGYAQKYFNGSQFDRATLQKTHDAAAKQAQKDVNATLQAYAKAKQLEKTSPEYGGPMAAQAADRMMQANERLTQFDKPLDIDAIERGSQAAAEAKARANNANDPLMAPYSEGKRSTVDDAGIAANAKAAAQDGLPYQRAAWQMAASELPDVIAGKVDRKAAGEGIAEAYRKAGIYDRYTGKDTKREPNFQNRQGERLTRYMERTARGESFEAPDPAGLTPEQRYAVEEATKNRGQIPDDANITPQERAAMEQSQKGEGQPISKLSRLSSGALGLGAAATAIIKPDTALLSGPLALREFRKTFQKGGVKAAEYTTEQQRAAARQRLIDALNPEAAAYRKKQAKNSFYGGLAARGAAGAKGAAANMPAREQAQSEISKAAEAADRDKTPPPPPAAPAPLEGHESRRSQMLRQLVMALAGAAGGAGNALKGHNNAAEYYSGIDDLQNKYGLGLGQAMALAGDRRAMNEFTKEVGLYGQSMSPQQFDKLQGLQTQSNEIDKVQSTLDRMKKLNETAGDAYSGRTGGIKGGLMYAAGGYAPDTKEYAAYREQQQLLEQFPAQFSSVIAGVNGGKATNQLRDMIQASHALPNDTAAVKNKWIETAQEQIKQAKEQLQDQMNQVRGSKVGRYGGLPPIQTRQNSFYGNLL